MSVKSLTHGARQSYPLMGGLGATAALFAAVPGAHACGQRPAGMAPDIMRFRAHSLTHAMLAILTEGIVVKWVRPKTGRRHECKISDPGLFTSAIVAA